VLNEMRDPFRLKPISPCRAFASRDDNSVRLLTGTAEAVPSYEAKGRGRGPEGQLYQNDSLDENPTPAKTLEACPERSRTVLDTNHNPCPGTKNRTLLSVIIRRPYNDAKP
jgi:hypothetical protein